MKRLGLALVWAASSIACSSTPSVVPTKNMDVPTDMTFVCLQLQDGVLSGVPMSNCHERGRVDPPTTSDGRRVLGTFAFIPNATRGEMAVADMDSGRLLDLSPAAPGYGMLPIGGDPESVASSLDGCWVATANRTTCDLTLVDPSRLLAQTFSQGSNQSTPVTGNGDSVYEISKILTGSGRTIRTAVGEIAFLPSDTTAGTCADRPQKVIATFPGCDLVAVMELSPATSAAKITSAYYVRHGGVEDAGTDPVCPADCGAYESTDSGFSAGDGGATAIDAGGPAASGEARLQPLALVPGGGRVYVGGLADPAITSLDIENGILTRPSRLVLAENPVGVTRIRLGIDPYATSTDSAVQGRFLDARGGRFLYAFAQDNSVRVVDVAPVAPVECDVNLVITGAASEAPGEANSLAVITRLASQGCFPVGSPLRRRALAQGPGLRVPTFSSPDSPAPLPRDIAFADLQPTDANVNALSGQFGFLLSSNGQVYVVNLAPNGEPYTATHSFREARDVGKGARNPLSVSIAPLRPVVVADQAFASTPSFAPGQGPMLKAFSSDSTPSEWFAFPDSYLETPASTTDRRSPPDPTALNWQMLPANDPNGIVSRVWDVVWEGVLPQTARESGIVKPAGFGSLPSSAGELLDNGADFCSSGVRPGDVLMFSGCVQDSDCQPDNLFSCQPTVSGGRGACLPRDNAKRDALTAKPSCAKLLGSRMRYEVGRVGPNGLSLGLKLDEVPKTTLNQCTTDKECQADTDHGLGATPDGGASAHAFQCLELRPQERHCVQKCTTDADCRPGNFCYAVPGLAPPFDQQGLCVQAPPLDDTCFAQPMTRYSVRAGNSYVVYGSSLPRVRDSQASKDRKTCEVVSTGNIELVNRIPFNAPRCPDVFAQGLLAAPSLVGVSAFSLPAGSNPCLYSQGATILAFYENPQIRFVLANLEQYAGDLVSIHFEFQTQYGFIPTTIPFPVYEIQLTMPERILTGPTMTPESPVRHSADTLTSFPYIYIVDQGRTVLTPGSRGQVVRINPRAGTNEIPTFDTAISGPTPFQLQ